MSEYLKKFEINYSKSVSKPWGSFKLLIQSKKITIKIISINAGNRTSLQLHEKRSEKWYVLEGIGIGTLEKEYPLKVNDEMFIPVKTPHRLEAITDLIILEISYGDFDESDIIRLDDDYSR